MDFKKIRLVPIRVKEFEAAGGFFKKVTLIDLLISMRIPLTN